MIGLLAAAVVAGASPVTTLACQSFTGTAVITYSLNEQNETASYESTAGGVGQARAIFTPTTVIIGRPDLQTQIDRRTLRMEVGSADSGVFHPVLHGQCELIEAPQTKF